MDNKQTPAKPSVWAWSRRWVRHAWSDAADARKAVGEAALTRLHQRVQSGEARHLGEIRICVEAGLSSADLLAGVSARQRALSVFAELGVWDTALNNGVLIFVLVADHAVEIVADRGLDALVAPEQWQTLVRSITAQLAQGHFEAGLNEGIDTLDDLLSRYFPRREGDTNPNELPDAPLVR